MHIRASVDIASLFCLVRIAFASEFVYHTAEAQREVLRSLHSAYPKLTRLETIGRFSANPVYTLVISKHGKRRFMIPRVHLLADFPAGTELLLQFGSYILQEYGRTQGITKLIDSTEVHLVPSLVTTNVNETSKKDCSADDRPHDLGKFPDYFNSNRVTDSTRYEVTEEVRLLMEWLRRGKFVLGGHLKGGMGDLVAAYGFHNGLPVSTTNVAPDRDSLVRLARIFAASHPRMKYGAAQCPGGHLGGFPGGVTNALSWKRQPGLLQDYAYVHEGTLVVTLSVSCCRIPQQSQLQTLWNENRIPLLAFLKEVHRGVRGYVKNVDGTHVPGASLVIKGRNVAFKSSEQGEFWRILLPGDYELLVSATGFLPAAVHFSVHENTSSSPLLVVTLTKAYPVVKILSVESYTTQDSVSERRGGREGCSSRIRSRAGIIFALSTTVIRGTCSVPRRYNLMVITIICILCTFFLSMQKPLLK